MFLKSSPGSMQESKLNLVKYVLQLSLFYRIPCGEEESNLEPTFSSYCLPHHLINAGYADSKNMTQRSLELEGDFRQWNPNFYLVQKSSLNHPCMFGQNEPREFHPSQAVSLGLPPSPP